MAIRTKAEMLAGITSMFADNDEGDITAAIARSEFNDWIDSLLVPGGIVGGAGISVSDNGDGSATVSAAGAAAAVGIPSYVAAGAAQPSDAVVTANIAGVTDSPPFPSLVYLLTPNDLDRAADDLELRINGDTSRVRELVNYLGDPLRARDLERGGLYEILAHASPTQQYRLTEPIPLRRQDWPFVYGSATYVVGQPPLTEAQANAFAVSRENSDFTIPTSFDVTTDFWYIGVPTSNIPPMGGFVFLPGERPTIGSVTTGDPATDLPGWINPEYMGEPFAWRYMSSIPLPPPRIRVLYDYDNY